MLRDRTKAIVGWLAYIVVAVVLLFAMFRFNLFTARDAHEWLPRILGLLVILGFRVIWRAAKAVSKAVFHILDEVGMVGVARLVKAFLIGILEPVVKRILYGKRGNSDEALQAVLDNEIENPPQNNQLH